MPLFVLCASGGVVRAARSFASLNRCLRWIGILTALGTASLLFSACALLPDRGADAPPSGLTLTSVRLNRLPGWNSDDLSQAVTPLRRSCAVIMARSADEAVGRTRLAGRVRDWQPACWALDRLPDDNPRATRRYFERYFRAWSVAGEGRFTGYYELAAPASLDRQGEYDAPLYRLPPSSSDQSLTRAAIEAGALSGKGLEIAYLNNAVDAFFLHIQGSGVLTLPDGAQVRVSYAGNNGQAFRSIQNALGEQGYDSTVEGGRIQDWRRWLLANPGVATEVMNSNPRYIFFRIHQSEGPLGAQGVPLTAGRSLAVDRDFIALGLPIWLDTHYREPNGERVPLRRLVIAQDTGTAIRGAVRGDFFWGSGEAALARAGGMSETGRYTILLPRWLNP